MHRLLAHAAAALIALAAPSAAQAAVTFASRTTTYNITTAGVDFSGSSVFFTTIVDFAGTGARTPTLNLNAGWSSLSIAGLGSTTVSYTAPTLGAAASILLTTNTPTAGTNGLSFALTYAANAAGVLQTTQVAGRYALAFSSNPSGFVENGNPYTMEATAAGDYSDTADWIAASYSSAFALLSETGTASAYNVRIQDATYNTPATGSPGPNLRFTLLGDAVPTPEPASMALLGAGVLGLAGLRRRR